MHLFGRPAPLDELAALGPPLIEDAAQAFGSPGIAGHGVASTFSFYPTKNLFALGDGGLVAARDPELGERIRLLRFHGSRAKKTFEYVGYNSRLDEIQAAVAADLPAPSRRVDAAAPRGGRALPRARARRPRRGARGRARPRLPPVRLPLAAARCDLRGARPSAGSRPATYYEPPLHLQPALAYLDYGLDSLPVTEQLARDNFSVPIWAGIDADTQEQVVDAVREALKVKVA